MGGGFPAAAFGGRADVMAHLAPAGPVYQAGTLSGNPVATAAGLAQLRLLDDAAYEKVDAVSAEIRTLVGEALTKEGVVHRLQTAGNMFSVFFTGSEVTDYEKARAQESFRFTAFFHSMLSQGVYLPPSAFESWFVSTAHDAAAVERIAAALLGRGAGRGPGERGGEVSGMQEQGKDITVVHLMRHGEVHNPEGVLYGRRSGYHLSDLG
ncbi:hypothetical protein GCM10020000_43740 [Streptomyces olivoverticillatus]